MSRIVLSLLALGLFAYALPVTAQESTESAPAADSPPAEETAASEEQAPAEETAEDAEAKPEPPAPSPEAVKAREAFGVVLKQWQDVTAQIPAIAEEPATATASTRAATSPRQPQPRPAPDAPLTVQGPPFARPRPRAGPRASS